MDADLVHALRIRGVDVTTALEQKMIQREDLDHLELATAQGRALYSFNVGDYHLKRLLKIIARVSAEEIENQIVFLSAW